MASHLFDKIRKLTADKAVDWANDTFKIILMASGYTQDRTSDGYANVSASELAGVNGYTAGGATLSGVAVTEDNTAHVCKITWSNATWSASGGNIGPSPGAIIYDDTITTPVADPLVGYIDFGGNQTQASGGTATIAGIEIDL